MFRVTVSRRYVPRYSVFFARKSGFPRFRSRRRCVGGFAFKGEDVLGYRPKAVKLPRFGWVRIKGKNRPPTGRILSATVKERAGRWFVSLQCELQRVVPENQGLRVGVDLGLKMLAKLSDGREFSNPRHLNQKLHLLRIRQRKLSRCKDGSNRRKRMKLKVAHTYYRIWCVRQDAIHKMTTRIAREYGAVGIEDLNVKGMVQNRSLARSLSDAAFGEIRRQLEYKCSWYGTRLHVWPRFYPSSKTCSRCGVIKDELPLSERIYRCDCGLVIDRDLNAAINLVPPLPQEEEARPWVTGLTTVEATTAVYNQPVVLQVDR